MLRRRPAVALIGVALATSALVAAFDWNWFRPALERRLTKTSGRAVRIGDLHVAFGPSFAPTVRLRQVLIENPAWASHRPMATAGEAAFTLAPRSLFGDRLIVTRLVLADADVSLERRADGLRNWRLTRPDDRGPGRVAVLAIEPRRSTIRFVHDGIGLDVTSAAGPAGAVSAPAGPNAASDAPAGEPLALRIALAGRWRGAAFDGEVLTGGVLTLRDTGRSFPLAGHLRSGGVRLEANGRAADLFRSPAFDGRAALAGASLAQLHPWTGARLPASRPWRVDADVKIAGARHDYSALQGRVGRSDFAGRASVESKAGRRRYEADLRSELADLADVGVGAPAVPRRRTDTGRGAGIEASPGPRPALSARAFDRAALRRADAALQLHVSKLQVPGAPALRSLALAGTLVDGALALTSIDVGVGGGHATGSLALDVRASPAAAALQAALRGARLEQLFPASAEPKRVDGALDGRVRLTARGDSLAGLVDHASGSIDAGISGGSVSRRLDARLALDLGRIAGAWFGGAGDRIAIACAAAAFDVRDGTATARRLALETATTHVAGGGTVDLRAGRLDLLLTPTPKDPGLLSLRRSIHVSGPLRRPAVELVAPTTRAAASSCRSGG